MMLWTARAILFQERVAISFAPGSSQPRERTHVSYIVRHILYRETTREAPLIACCSVNSGNFGVLMGGGEPEFFQLCCLGHILLNIYLLKELRNYERSL